jgi:hypothetical protein
VLRMQRNGLSVSNTEFLTNVSIPVVLYVSICSLVTCIGIFECSSLMDSEDREGSVWTNTEPSTLYEDFSFSREIKSLSDSPA